MESSILGSKKTLHMVESLLYSYPSSGIIIATADYFFLPFNCKIMTDEKGTTCTYICVCSSFWTWSLARPGYFTHLGAVYSCPISCTIPCTIY
jgi:hypothetical protein